MVGIKGGKELVRFSSLRRVVPAGIIAGAGLSVSGPPVVGTNVIFERWIVGAGQGNSLTCKTISQLLGMGDVVPGDVVKGWCRKAVA